MSGALARCERDGLRLEWTLHAAPDGSWLRVEYTLANGRAQPVYCLDATTVFAGTEGIAVDPEALIVLQEPGQVDLRLIRGFYPHPVAHVQMELMPGARLLTPGAALEGHARVPLPLQAWYPNLGHTALAGRPTQATLCLGVVPGSLSLRDQALADGSVVRVPERSDVLRFQEWLEAGPLPVPAAACPPIGPGAAADSPPRVTVREVKP